MAIPILDSNGNTKQILTSEEIQTEINNCIKFSDLKDTKPAYVVSVNDIEFVITDVRWDGSNFYGKCNDTSFSSEDTEEDWFHVNIGSIDDVTIYLEETPPITNSMPDNWNILMDSDEDYGVSVQAVVKNIKKVDLTSEKEVNEIIDARGLAPMSTVTTMVNDITSTVTTGFKDWILPSTDDLIVKRIEWDEDDGFWYAYGDYLDGDTWLRNQTLYPYTGEPEEKQRAQDQNASSVTFMLEGGVRSDLFTCTREPITVNKHGFARITEELNPLATRVGTVEEKLNTLNIGSIENPLPDPFYIKKNGQLYSVSIYDDEDGIGLDVKKA